MYSRQPVGSALSELPPFLISFFAVTAFWSTIAASRGHSSRTVTAPSPPPLAGIRVLELGQLLAGPFAGCVLGYFGAEVIKVEPLTGDPLRNWRVLRDGTSLWWYSLARNKKSVAIDLQTEDGRELVRKLAMQCDVLIENFKPGTMEKWGLGPTHLKASKPDLIYTRVSGYGQTGPYASKPGFASVCEAIGGLRYVNGFADRPPVRPNLSLGDSLAGMHAVIGVLLALLARGPSTGSGQAPSTGSGQAPSTGSGQAPSTGSGQAPSTSSGQAPRTGQVVDVAIYESIFNMLEGVVPEFDGAGVIRGPSGSTLTGIVPSNTYLCADDKYVVIGANGDSLFQRLMRAIGKPDLASDPRLANNAGRVQHEREIDEVISAWTRSNDSVTVLRTLDDISVPGGPIYSVADMAADPHFNARGLFQSVEIDGKPLKIPAIAPLLTDTPGRTETPGPKLGEHTDAVLRSLLGATDGDLVRFRAENIIR
jgi:crotonobetainyl-CoA:carnitine CoA-transferase CaiB-like acyl-CoA transferase